MKVSTSKLTGSALNWAVAKCEDVVVKKYPESPSLFFGKGFDKYRPSTDWSQAGPIIERENISVVCAEGEYNYNLAGTPNCYGTFWVADIGKQTSGSIYGPQSDHWGDCFQIDVGCITGPTPLIAAMRCYVASKLGDVVEVPNELWPDS